jgi:hypothetical protein
MPTSPSKKQVKAAKNMVPMPVSNNGHADHPDIEISDDVLGEDRPAHADRPIDVDLDDALGDEQALKHDLLDYEPPAIEVRVPRKREYIMVHPTLERVTQVIEYTAAEGIGRTYYLATGNMRRRFEEEDLKKVRLVLCMSLHDRSLFLWPMNEDESGTENRWNETSRQFVEEYAKKYWARRVSLRKSGGSGYGKKFAPEGHALPTWPDKSMKELIAEAFKDRIISSVDHPVYRDIEQII